MASPKLPTIAVHVTPRAGGDEVMGIATADDGASEVRVRVSAPPDGGKANKAVCKLLAAQIGVAKSAVSVKRGETSRHKLIEVNGSESAVSEWLASLPRL